MAEELGALAEDVGQLVPENLLEAWAVRGRDAVPGLGGAVVQVVDAGQVQVLRVPACEWAGSPLSARELASQRSM